MITTKLSPKIESLLKNLVIFGAKRTKSAVLRKALDLLSEQEAIEAVVKAKKESSLRGDLRKLLKKLKRT